MSMSRAEFVRMMGLSDDDLQKPPEAKPATTRSRFATVEDEDDDVPTHRPNVTAAAKPASYTSSGGPTYTSSASKPTSSATGQSRADFLRSLGIDNMDAPQGDAGPTTSKRTQSSAAAPSTAAPPTAGAAPRTSATGQSREEFLRSMGIDNAQAPEGVAASGARNATGSQELPRMPFQQQAGSYSNTSANRTGGTGKTNVSRILDQDSDGYTPRTPPKSHASDFTLGPKPTIQKAPETPGLDAELRGMKDSAGAEERKAMGNKYFQAGDYRKAVRLYTQAIELDGTNAALYSNRSAAYLLGGKQMGIDTRSMSLRDAEKTIKLKPTWFKGYSRRGDALFKLERYDDAKEAYEKALEFDPGNTSIVHSLNELRPFTLKKPAEPSTWSAPGSGNLYSSVASLSGVKKTDKSAYEMLDEFQREREHSTPHLGRGGSDYKLEQLERFRQRQSSETSSSFHTSTSHCSPHTESRSSQGGARTSVPQEFSSEAAQNYQSALLESYRKKKQAKQSGQS